MFRLIFLPICIIDWLERCTIASQWKSDYPLTPGMFTTKRTIIFYLRVGFWRFPVKLSSALLLEYRSSEFQIASGKKLRRKITESCDVWTIDCAATHVYRVPTVYTRKYAKATVCDSSRPVTIIIISETISRVVLVFGPFKWTTAVAAVTEPYTRLSNV